MLGMVLVKFGLEEDDFEGLSWQFTGSQGKLGWLVFSAISQT
jgi:hypothetical protein